jgi:outer membrane protein TolC
MNLTDTHKLSGNTVDLRRQIAQRAYELYEQRGRQDGFALQDWLQAEQELTAAPEELAREEFFVKKAV